MLGNCIMWYFQFYHLFQLSFDSSIVFWEALSEKWTNFLDNQQDSDDNDGASRCKFALA